MDRRVPGVPKSIQSAKCDSISPIMNNRIDVTSMSIVACHSGHTKKIIIMVKTSLLVLP